MQVVADQEELEESFHLNVLDSDAGVQMADRILSSCAERLLQKQPVFSDHPDRQGICTDGLGGQILCSRSANGAGCLRRWMYLPEGR